MRFTCPHCQSDLELAAPPTPEKGCPDCGERLADDLFVETVDITAPCAEETGSSAPPEATASSSSDSLSPGPIPTRFGRYRVTGELAPGELAAAFRGHDEELGRDVAIWVPRPETFRSPEAIESLLRMGRSLAQLDHPAIIPVYDVGRTDDGWCYQVSKLVEGQLLSDVTRRERLGLLESLRIVARVARALHHAHRRGMIHQGLKPFNILLDRSREPHLAYFGLDGREHAIGNKPTSESSTPAYQSPEQACDEGHRVDARTDIYSLGVILYEVLAGSWPLHGLSRGELKSRIREIEIPPLRRVDARIPAEVERICQKAMSPRISDRHSTALDLAEELEACVAALEQASQAPEVAPSLRSTTQSQTLATSDGTPTPTPTAARTTESIPSSSPVIPKVIPKGLRSFDGDDAEFFLDLLPGPRDRDGLPESLRFWIRRIDERDPEATFPVGLIYGPSGCGKSSLVKAGLIPRLPASIQVVYIEATTDGTESRVLDRLHRRFPLLAETSTLREAFAALRRGEGLAGEGKVVVFVDQFEQWLHGHGHEEEQGELIRAFRQCDGGRLQCVLMVRDDFWMGITRFFGQLEVPLSEGQNSAAVDLFSPRHTRKVLIEFGRAFGTLPDVEEDFSSENRDFLEEAVAELARDGATIPVRVALFADMVKGRRWTASNLRSFGGAEGIGVTFLEETFSSDTAPPEYRFHQRAVRAVLTALLPEKGTDIKGHMRSRDELLAVTGYEKHPREFEELLRILDNRLRLVTPTDPLGIAQNQEQEENAARSKKATSQENASSSYYYLTHDYLVPAIREWLVRKRKETARGRAELLLQERTMTWNSRPEKKYLPSFLEWCRIRYHTRRRIWTPAARRMMRQASRQHVIRSVLVLLVVGLLSWGLLGVAQSIRSRLLRDQLLYVETTDAEEVLARIRPRLEVMEPLLVTALKDAPANSSARLNLALALRERDASQVDYLLERSFELPVAEFRIVRDALREHREALENRLWTLLEDSTTPPARRLRAAELLAAYDPPEGSNSEKWNRVAEDVASMLHAIAVDEPGRYNELVMELAPASEFLLETLVQIARDENRDPAALSIARNLVVDYAGERPDLLTEMLLADPAEERARKVISKLESNKEQAVVLLSPVLDQSPADLVPTWNETERSFSPPSAALVESFARSTGFLTDEFALVQTLPLSDFDEITEDLRAAGYRPLHFEPYLAGDVVRVASIFTRDGREWSVQHGLDATEVQKALESVAAGQQLLEDLTSYEEPDGEIRFSLSQAERTSADPERLGWVGEDGPEWEAFQQGPARGFGLVFLHRRQLDRGLPFIAAVLEKDSGTVVRHQRTSARYERELLEDDSGRLQVDIDVSSTRLLTLTQARRYQAEQERIFRRAEIESGSAPLNRWYELGESEFICENYEETIRACEHYARNGGTSWRLSNSIALCIVSAARLGRLDQARGFAEEGAREGAGTSGDRMMWRYLVELHSEQDIRAVLEKAETALAGDWMYLAVVYSKAVAVVKESDPELARRLADRALAVIQLQRETSAQEVWGWLRTYHHFKPIYEAPGFKELFLDEMVYSQSEIQLARLGEADEARRETLRISPSASLTDRIGLLAMVETFLGNDDVLSWIEGQIRPWENRRNMRLNATAEAYSLASFVHRGDPDRCRELASRAFGHIEAVLPESDDPLDVLRVVLSEEDFFPLQDDPRFPRLLSSLNRVYSSSYRTANSGLESRESHGLDPEAHLSLSRSLAETGFRPRAISACLPTGSDKTEVASVWHRPVVHDAQRDDLARRQATAAAALLRLGQPDRMIALLENRDDPRLRAFLLDRLEGILGDHVELLTSALEGQETPSIRQAIVLALGIVLDSSRGAGAREELAPRLLEMCRDDSDTGVRSAAAWALRRWGLEKQLHELERSLGAATPGNDRNWWITPTGATMSLIRGPVEFDMGSAGDEPRRESDEKLHRRRVPRSFAIGTREVTVAEFQEFLRENLQVRHSLNRATSPEPDCPVGSVTWFQAAQYCRWLSEKEGLPEVEMCYPPVEQIRPGMKLPFDHLERSGYRLPTEAEWEYAARAGSRAVSYHGASPELIAQYGWFKENSENRSWPVGSLFPNAFGLFDVLGNVQEWCAEAYESYPVSRDGVAVVPSPDTGAIDERKQRVYRGGSFQREFTSTAGRLADRNPYAPGVSYQDTGFRIARTLPGDEALRIREILRDAKEKRAAADIAAWRAARERASAAYSELFHAEPEREDLALSHAALLLEDLDGWTVVEPTEVTSANGTVLESQPDGSVVASGPNPATETYTVRFKAPSLPVVGLRLEALADSSNGPGRSSIGNFLVNRIETLIQGNDQTSATTVKWDQALASFEEATSADFTGLAQHTAAQILVADDEGNGKGWAIYPAVSQSHELILIAREPVGPSSETEWTVRIHQGPDGLTLGRFRLSVAGDPQSLEDEAIRMHLRQNAIHAWIQLAVARILRGEDNEARTAFSRDQRPESEISRAEHLARAWVYQRLGQVDEARRTLALAIGPFAEGNALPEVTIPLAADIIDRLLESSSRNFLWLHSVDFFTRQTGVPADAELPPTGTDALAVAFHLLEQRLPFRGVVTAEKVLADEDLRNPETLLALARLQHRTGHLGDAVGTLEEALRRTGSGTSMNTNIQASLQQYRDEALPRLLTYGSLSTLSVSEVMILPEGATWKFFRGVREPSPALEWTALGFDDVRWEEGISGFGYSDGDDRTEITDMQDRYTTLYLRRVFEIDDPDEWKEVTLSVWVDDGFVAYLNGEEVGRHNAQGSRVAFDGVASATVGDGEAASPIDLTGKLVAGKNIIAVQGLNAEVTSSDLSLSPVVTGEFNEKGVQRRLERLGRLNDATRGPMRRYFEALASQASGDHETAIAGFEQVIRSDPGAPEPWLALIESLKALGRASDADSRLRSHFTTSKIVSGVLLDAWFRLSRVDLDRDWAEVYRLVPRSTLYTAEGAGNDVLWALRTLQETGALRINCGGADFTGEDGRFWGRDRFSLASSVFDGPRGSGIVDATLYRRASSFDVGESDSTEYRIPLPTGHYEVTLGFCDRRRDSPRRLDIEIEGATVVVGIPLKGASPEFHSFPCRVEDGYLDLELAGYRVDPILSSIEIVRLDRSTYLARTDAWIERTARLLPTALVLKAQALVAADQREEALRLVEEASRLPGFASAWSNLLREVRVAVAPDLLTFASIDAALGSERATERVEEFREVANGEGFAARRDYLEGRLLQKQEKHAEAFERFRAAATGAPGQPEPLLRALESLVRLPADARASLHGEWELQLAEDKTLPESARLLLTNLWETTGRKTVLVEELVQAVPDLAALPATDPLIDELWALRELEARSVLRINCGGATVPVEQNGVAWSIDRLFVGDTPVYGPGGTRVDLSERQFPDHGEETPAYRIPLPSGPYRVTLSFMEGYDEIRVAGGRRIDVRLEGQTVLRDYDPIPAVGFQKLDVRSFTTWVGGGALEIHLIQRANHPPSIRAIEVERLDPADWLTLLGAPGTSRLEARHDSLGALARAAFDRGDVSRAIGLLVAGERLEGFSQDDRDLRLEFEQRLSELIQNTLETPRELVFRGSYYLYLDRVAEAAVDYDRALSLSQAEDSGGAYGRDRIWQDIFSHDDLSRRVVELRPEDTSFLRAAFDHCLEAGKWMRAKSLLPRLDSIEDSPSIDYYQRAVLTLFSGDREGYLEICRRMPERLATFPERERYQTPERLVRSCLLLPLSSEVSAQYLELLRRVNLSEASGAGLEWYRQALGLALYRAGRFEESIVQLERAQSRSTYWEKDCTNHLLIGMAKYRLGRKEEALASVKRADDLVAARNLTGPGIDMTMWQDWMVFQILRREARDLIAESEAPESERPR